MPFRVPGLGEHAEGETVRMMSRSMSAMVGRLHMNMAAYSLLWSTPRLWIVLTGFDIVGRILGWCWLKAWGFA